MRVFLCEYVTAGGLRSGSLPASLAREGRLMRDALARDLLDLAGVTLSMTHDDRLPPPSVGESAPVTEGVDPWPLWRRLASEADAAWVVAPETGGLLERLVGLCASAGATIVGPDLAAIRIAASKRATAERLATHGVAVAPVWRPDGVPPGEAGPFVSKPDDGAGCDATRLWTRAPSPADLPVAAVIQRYVPGEAASLTVLRRDGTTFLLAANRQRIAVHDGALQFDGLDVAAFEDPDGRLAALAREVGCALPGLDGLFGIDIVLGEAGPVVIEVNPRLTTAYAGLRDALGLNPAALVAPFAAADVVTPPLASRTVEVRP